MTHVDIWPRGTSRIVKLLRKQGAARRMRAKFIAVRRAASGQRFGLSPVVYTAVVLGWRVDR